MDVKSNLLLVTNVLLILCLASGVLADSCPHCSRTYGAGRAGGADSAYIQSIRAAHEATCSARSSKVTKKNRGPLIVFQAHDHDIAVDWAFEVNQENIDKSIRHFPIDIVLLNNSFETIEFEEAGIPLFTFKIRSGINHIIKEYVSLQKTVTMLPGERINCMINWDGRDVDGKYALPGRYEFITEVPRLKGHSKLKISRNFEITEAGPNVGLLHGLCLQNRYRRCPPR